MPCAPLEFDECCIREVFRNHMTRHVPPAQASPEQIVLRAEVIHPPLVFAGDPLLCLFRIGLIVGYDELDVPAQFLPRDKRWGPLIFQDLFKKEQCAMTTARS